MSVPQELPARAECARCERTGVTIERREGTNYPSACRSCERFDPAQHNRADLYRIIRFMNDNPPVVHQE